MIDLQGKVVLNQQMENANLIESISIANLPKGMYLAVLETDSHRISKKIIVE